MIKINELIMDAISLKEFRKSNNLTQSQLSEITGVSLRAVQSWEQGVRNVPQSAIKLIEGYERNNNNKLEELKTLETEQAGLQEMIPLIPISAQGGSLTEFTESIREKDCERILSPIKGAEFAITVSGDSMAPEYSNGSQLLIKKINDEAFIEWGKVYVLDTCNGVVVKRVIPSKKENCIQCISDNKSEIFAPFDVCKDDIFAMYRVLLCMSVK